MTAGTAPPPSPTPPAAPPPPPAKPASRVRRIAIGVGIFLGVVTVYVLSLVGVHLLAQSGPRLPAFDASQYQKEDTVVDVRVEELKTVANRLSVNVLVSPKESLIDQDSRVLTTDAAVRLYPETDLGDQQYPKGKRWRKSPPRSWRTAIPVTGHSTPTPPTKSRAWSSPGVTATKYGPVWK